MSDERDGSARGLSRRAVLGGSVVAGLAAAMPAASGAGGSTKGAAKSANRATGVPAFEFEEATVADLARAMNEGRLTARRLTEGYLARIEAVDRAEGGPALRSVLEINPDALAIADALDRERKEKGPRGPLHGIPVLVKDNCDTADRMKTTAGSLALVDAPTPAEDSTVVARLRAAGAVLLGKTNLSEWANFRSNRSLSGWSGRGGQTRNPYALDRSPSGSSSGTGAAISANLATVGIGTETDGSIVSPSSAGGLVGIKPTVGLVSRAGIIPISASQDTAGPMCRTVADAAAVLSAIAGADPRDAATAEAVGARTQDFLAALDPDGLKGARIGVLRERFAGRHPILGKILDASVAALQKAGASVVDPVVIETDGQFDDPEFEVLLYEFKDGLEKYFASRGAGCPVKTLAELIAWNEANREREMPYFGQETAIRAAEKGPLTDTGYLAALALCRDLSRTKGIDATLDKHQLDALVVSTNGLAWIVDPANGDAYTGGSSSYAAVAGYPSVTVPAGFAFGLPTGLSFIGRAWSDAQVIRYAYAFEQATKARRAPQFRAHADFEDRI